MLDWRYEVMDMSLSEMLDVKERNEDYTNNIFSSTSLKENIITFKMISKTLSAAGAKVEELEEQDFLNHRVFVSAQRELIRLMAEMAKDFKPGASEVILYQTGHISKFFGVSQTTISNWVMQNRFEGIVRTEAGKHVEIPSNTLFTYPNGKQVYVREIVERYEERMRKIREEENAEEESNFLEYRLREYEDRYGSIDKLEQEIESGIRPASDGGLDLDVWRYLVKRRAVLLV
jgi:hypothetical protein